MRILLVSYYFPPYNTIGAIRLGKMARYLSAMGHEVRVLTAISPSLLDKSLDIDVGNVTVYKTPWFDLSRLSMIKEDANNSSNTNTNLKFYRHSKYLKHKTLIKAFKKLYRSILYIPDREVGWYKFAMQKVREIFKSWIPDIVYASTPPTCLMIAYQIYKLYDIPYVAELRDLWSVNHYDKAEYYSLFGLRELIQEKLEKKVLRSAKEVIVVSEGMREILAKKYNINVHVIPNGFDPEDYKLTINETEIYNDSLRIVYTGTLYNGKRDPSILFEALRELIKENILVEFYGPDCVEVLEEKVQTMGLGDKVKLYTKIPRNEALKKQFGADVLLVLLWNTPEEENVYTGKLFEYIGTGRPILVIGPKQNIAARFVVENGIGKACETVKEVVETLKEWINLKRSGRFLGYDPLRFYEYTREFQAIQLESILKKAAKV